MGKEYDPLDPRTDLPKPSVSTTITEAELHDDWADDLAQSICDAEDKRILSLIGLSATQRRIAMRVTHGY
jgi:hypothetical protein